jgi:choline dehydrogenase-like flavoprotein
MLVRDADRAGHMGAMLDDDLPTDADVMVVGDGAAGAARAGSLARETQAEKQLLEAGSHHGGLAQGGWPSALLDAR